ncbi:MAG: hypothetical protein QXU39_02225 [Candidatus Pacearchaeota archaeon]
MKRRTMKKKALISFSIGISLTFLGILNLLDVIIYMNYQRLVFPIIFMIAGIFIFYKNLHNLIK